MTRHFVSHLLFATGALTGLLFALDAARSEETDATRRLKALTPEFREEVIKVADGVYTAVGYSVSNSSLIVGDSGVIIVDTGLDPVRGKTILEQFRKITDKPVAAIIFTHGHGDHTGGASAFIEEGTKPQVWARSNFGSEDRPLQRAGLTIQRVRGARQGGFQLPPAQRINNGIAPAHYPQRQGSVFEASGVAPTHTFKENRTTVTTAGVTLDLVAAPGETDDQLYVWLPKTKVLFCGDEFYKSFPNLYAIRGTPYRDVRAWADSLTRMIEEGAETLVPGHTRPILGAGPVREVLTDYRDAVKFVHDKTVEGMNLGLTPDELVEFVKLPAHLAEKDSLQPFYGNVEWGVRSIFSGYLGWFDGNPTNLFPLTPKEQAQRIADLAGGAELLLQRGREAFERGDAQWAAQLADNLLALDSRSVPARTLKADALTVLGERCVTATGRNYYLTVAAEFRKPLKPAP